MKEHPLSSLENLVPAAEFPARVTQATTTDRNSKNPRPFKAIETAALGPVGEPVKEPMGTTVFSGCGFHNSYV